MTALRLLAALLLGLLLTNEGWAQQKAGGSSATEYQEPTEPESREAIRRKLQIPITAEFVETPLKDVVAFVGDSIQVQIKLDTKSLEEAAIAIDSPITISLRNVRADTFLTMLLTRHLGGLDFVRREGFVEISTIRALDQQMEPRVYLARDLPGVTPESPDVEAAINLIQTAVEPTSWEVRGGEGTIVHYGPILVIRQSPRVHDRIEDLLHEAREAIAKSGKQ